MKRYKVVIGKGKLDTNTWREFVKDNPNGNIFQTPEIYDAYEQTDQYEPEVIAVLDTDDNIIGLQVSVIIKIYSGVMGSLTARSIIYGGPLILNNDRNVLDILLNAYKNRMKGKALFSQFRNMWDWAELKDIFIKNRIRFEDHLDILFDLIKGEDKLWQEMDRSRRKGINQSYKKAGRLKK